MTYKKILVIHPTHDAISALDPALDFARSVDASLDILVLNLAGIPAVAMTQNPEYDWSRTFSELLLETEKREKDVIAYLEESGLAFSVQSECAPLGLIDDLVSKAALCTDVVVFTNGQSSFVGGLVGQALEGALIDAGKPVFVLTGKQQASLETPEKIVIAWDEVPQAAHAVQAAIPMLQNAQSVEILVICENSDQAEAVDSAAALGKWLKLHGISPKISTIARDGQFVSHAMANYLDGQKCDLLVMGAYGHSRTSERLFAGATHVALTDMDVPLLLAH